MDTESQNATSTARRSVLMRLARRNSFKVCRRPRAGAKASGRLQQSFADGRDPDETSLSFVKRISMGDESTASAPP